MSDTTIFNSSNAVGKIKQAIIYQLVKPKMEKDVLIANPDNSKT